jgi:hypothetical protein
MTGQVRRLLLIYIGYDLRLAIMDASITAHLRDELFDLAHVEAALR